MSFKRTLHEKGTLINRGWIVETAKQDPQSPLLDLKSLNRIQTLALGGKAINYFRQAEMKKES